MSMLPEDDPPPQNDPVEPGELSRFLLAQIDERMKESLHSAERHPKYYVIRSQATGVLSVLASSTLEHDHDIVWGPRSFAACIAYVNSALVTREAEDGAEAQSPKPEEKP